jgi:quercetin dioxygenase-like cupin family protein
MKFSAFDRSKAKRSTSDYFSGEVYMQEIVPESDSKEVTVAAVFFENGARTLPHIHPTDQILSVVEGTCVVADENGLQELPTGGFAVVTAGEWHWHGAKRGTSACHLSIKAAGETNWSVPKRDWDHH